MESLKTRPTHTHFNFFAKSDFYQRIVTIFKQFQTISNNFKQFQTIFFYQEKVMFYLNKMTISFLLKNKGMK